MRTPLPQGIGETPKDFITSVADVTGQGVPQILSRIYAAETGRTSVRYITGDMLGRFFIKKGKKKAEALFKEAMFNPKLATEMSQYSISKVEKPKIRQRLNFVLFNLGYPELEKRAINE